jgi:hypothetical protein
VAYKIKEEIGLPHVLKKSGMERGSGVTYLELKIGLKNRKVTAETIFPRWFFTNIYTV